MNVDPGRRSALFPRLAVLLVLFLGAAGRQLPSAAARLDAESDGAVRVYLPYLVDGHGRAPATATPTRWASSTPSATHTPAPTWTPEPPSDTPEPSPTSPFVGRVQAEMGTTSESGSFIPGPAFPHGTTTLCQHVLWQNVPIGTRIRWQWYTDSVPITPDNRQLNKTIAVAQETGESEMTCIQYGNLETGEPVPLAEAVYSVNVWVGDVAEDDPVVATDSVVIGDPPPPDRTLNIDFGTRAESGVFTPGTVYRYGLTQLCVRVKWWHQPDGAEVRWQWFADDQMYAPDDTFLNMWFEIPEEKGTEFSCLVILDDQGAALPIPRATYRVDLWLDQVGPTDPVYKSVQAVVGDEGTPPPPAVAPPDALTR